MDWFNEWFSSPFSGMSGWTSLFGGYYSDQCGEGEHAWDGGPNCGWAESWQEGVSQFFCETVIFGSMDCWIAHLCETFQYADDMDTDETAFTTTSTGEVIAAAHIEGERGASAVQFPDGAQYYYKLSFFATNPSADDDLKITIKLTHSGGTKNIGTVELEPGSTYSAAGSSIQIFYSPNKYTKMEMSFSPDLDTAVPSTFYGLVGQGGTIDKIENNFVEVGTGATDVDDAIDEDEDDDDDGGDGDGDGGGDSGDEDDGCDSSSNFCWG
jgi:hypothetical protein